MKSQPVLSDSETFSEVDGDTQPLNIIKKKINNGVKVQRNPLCAKKNIVLMNEKAQTDSCSKSSA